MPAFVRGGTTFSDPIGPNEYLRSTQDVKFESYTVAAASVPTETINGIAGQKVLQRGVVMAKITSGGDSGKIGPFQAGVTDGRQTLANIVGLNDTYLPWQLLEHDEQVAVAYMATAVQAWCYELNAGGARIALTNTTADAMRSVKGMDVTFK